MAGTIKHEWNGTVLTITSDSGTSSADLKGSRGDDGIRGAQGVPGECLHRHELALTTEQQLTARNNISAYRAINETGKAVEFEAEKGLPLTAITTLEPNLEGYAAITLNHSGGSPETVFNTKEYGGSYDWTGGEYKREWIYRELGSNNGWIWNDFAEKSYCFMYVEDKGTVKENEIICSHMPQALITSNTTETGINITNQFAGTQARISVRPDLSVIPNLAAWRAYLDAQAAAGTPVKAVYKKVSPTKVYYNPIVLETEEGINKFSSNEGETTITNYKGNSGIINSLLERVAALEDNLGG